MLLINVIVTHVSYIFKNVILVKLSHSQKIYTKIIKTILFKLIINIIWEIAKIPFSKCHFSCLH